MPAYFESGVFVREPAWHGLGHVLTDYTDRKSMMKLAGHDFTLVEEELFIHPEGAVVEGWKALRREDSGKIISVVKDSYEIIQNEQVWDILDAIVAKPEVKYETAGVLKGGAVIWALARLDEPVQIKGDNARIYPFVNVSSSHDGSGSCKAFTTSIRTVCWNTMSAGESEAQQTGLSYRFRHTKNVQDRIEFARASLGLARENLSSFFEMASDLAERGITYQHVKLFVERFIPSPDTALISDRVLSNIEAARLQVIHTLNESVTVPEEHRRTAYGLFCAGSEYLDHLRAYRTNETHFNRCIMDNGRSKHALLALARSVSEEEI